MLPDFSSPTLFLFLFRVFPQDCHCLLFSFVITRWYLSNQAMVFISVCRECKYLENIVGRYFSGMEAWSDLANAKIQFEHKQAKQNVCMAPKQFTLGSRRMPCLRSLITRENDIWPPIRQVLYFPSDFIHLSYAAGKSKDQWTLEWFLVFRIGEANPLALSTPF